MNFYLSRQNVISDSIGNEHFPIALRNMSFLAELVMSINIIVLEICHF